MRTWPRRPSTRVLTALTAGGLLVATGGVASADYIATTNADQLTTSVKAMSLVLGAEAGKASITISGQDNDGDPGCNFDGAAPGAVSGSPETVTVNLTASSDVVRVEPASLLFTACDEPQSVTVTPRALGDATVTATVATGTNRTGGTFNVSNGRVSVKVTDTKPTVRVSGVTPNGEYVRGSAPPATCTITDAEDFPDGPSIVPARLTELAGPYVDDHLGTRYAMCDYTDKAGTQVLDRQPFHIVDKTPPVITRDPVPTVPATGWYRGDVVVGFKVVESQSTGSLKTTGCEPPPVVTDTRLTTLTCTATSAGGTNSVSTNVRRDATAPVVAEGGTVTAGTPGNDGWYTSPVTVGFTAEDETSAFLTPSGTVRTTLTQTVTTTTEGEQVVTSPAFTDRAGNTTDAGATSRSVKVDTSAPNAPEVSVTPTSDGWSTEDVTVTFTAAGDNGPSGMSTCTEPVTVTEDTQELTVEGTCTDVAGNESEATEVTVKLDKTAPAVTADAPAPTGSNDWYTSDVDVAFTATDDTSGPATAAKTVTSSGEGAAVEVESPAFEDVAGNTAAAGEVTKTYAVDKTAPAVPTFTGGGLAAYLYPFGDKPAAPTCTSSDATSGLASCVVTGDGSTVGVHTYTATATDEAGHTSTATRRYVVAPWITRGYSSPIAMRGLNTVTAGSTIAVKFEVFAGLKRLTDPAKVTMSSKPISCPRGVSTTNVSKAVTTGSTSLRYDSAAGKFVYTWKTPTGAGTCHALTMKTADGSSTTANFTLK